MYFKTIVSYNVIDIQHANRNESCKTWQTQSEKKIVLDPSRVI